MRLIMMGTGPFAVPTFESLLASEHHVVALFTRPSAELQTHGKRKTAPNPMREAAERAGIQVSAPPDVNSPESRTQLAELAGDLLVVCDYGQILAPETLAVTRLGGINLHGSLLPKYRGAAPVNWAIWRGETETGVTVIHMTPRLDAGPALVQVSTEIGPDETTVDLEPRLARLGVQPVADAIGMLEQWDGRTPLGTPQDPSLATRARRLRKSDGAISWSRTAHEIYCQFRALQPWPGVFTHLHSPATEPLRIILDRIQPLDASMGCAAPGTIMNTSDNALLVAAGGGSVAVYRLKPAGGRVMEAAEFLRGRPVAVGDILSG